MHEGIDLLPELYPRCFCRTNRRPLKIGVSKEFMSQLPGDEMLQQNRDCSYCANQSLHVFGAPFTKVRRA